LKTYDKAAKPYFDVFVQTLTTQVDRLKAVSFSGLHYLRIDPGRAP